MLLEELLATAGITPEGDPELYQILIETNCKPMELARKFEALKSIGATPRDELSLYLLASSVFVKADWLTPVFKMLKGMGVTLREHQRIYFSVLTFNREREQIEMIFKKLNEAGFAVQDDSDLYAMMILNLPDDGYTSKDNVFNIFKILKNRGAKFNVSGFFVCLIKNPDWCKEALNIFDILDQLGLTLPEHDMIYEKALSSTILPSRIPVIFQALKVAGATLNEHASLYEKVITFGIHAETVQNVTKRLISAGATFQDHLDLFTKSINSIEDLDISIQILNVLNENGIKPEDHLALYYVINQRKYNLQQIDTALKALKKIGATFKEHNKLYQTVIEYATDADKLDKLFAILEEAGATLKYAPGIYEIAAWNASDADILPKLFKILAHAGATLQDHQRVYEMAISQISYVDSLPDLFAMLKEAGATFKDHSLLYELFLVELNFLDTTITAFKTLQQAGFTLEKDLRIYQEVLESGRYASSVANLYKVLLAQGIMKHAYPKLYANGIRTISFDYHVDNIYQIFSALEEAGATLDEHPHLYEDWIQKVKQAPELFILVKALKEAGITVASHLKLYEMISQNYFNPENHLVILKALTDKRISCKDYPKLYEASFKDNRYARKFPIIFKAFHDANIPVEAYPGFYEAAIKNAFYAEEMPFLFQAFYDANIPVEAYPGLYEAAIKNACDAEKFAIIFKALHDLNIIVEAYPVLYQACIENASDTENFALLFQNLKSTRITPNEYPMLYALCIKNAYYAEKLTAALNMLEGEGIVGKDTPATYELIINNAYRADSLAAQFKLLHELGATEPNYQSLYALVAQTDTSRMFACLNQMRLLGLKLPTNQGIIEQAISQSSFALEILTWLKANNLMVNTHGYIYDACFLGEEPIISAPYYWHKFKVKLEGYLKVHPLDLEEGYAQQQQDIHAILDSSRNNNRTEGPLNRTPETCKLEAVLAQISTERLENIRLRYDESLGYMLQLGDKPEIYLTELLRLVNFNHINLPTEVIESLGDKIEALSPGFIGTKESLLPDNLATKKLPEAARSALAKYLGYKCYRNINRMFRGVPQTAETHYAWITPVNGRENLIANFLSGCLINWAAAELPRIVISLEERIILEKLLSRADNPADIIKRMRDNETDYQEILAENCRRGLITEAEYSKIVRCFDVLTVLFPIYDELERAENLEAAGQEEQQAIENRLTSGVFTPSVTSFSTLRFSSPAFQNPSLTRTVLETSKIRPVVNRMEGEVLVPAGTCLEYAQKSHQFFAREINSPGMVPQGGVWSMTALAEALKEHLTHPYKDSPSEITLGNQIIQRPNHGLAHTYRVMLYIDVVIGYFALHAEDKAFRLFCQFMQPEAREWLRVAAAFSVTGRESEIAAIENLARYDEFRKASVVNMGAFLDKFPPKTDDPLMRERMLEILRWMGNPEYEKRLAVNQHGDTAKCFLLWILTNAHKLDLVRCYGHEQFESAMTLCRTLSGVTAGSEQEVDYLGMISFAVDLNKAHGNALQTCLSDSGELQSCSKGYRHPFGVVSKSLRQLRAASESVPRIKTLEPYQYPHIEIKPT